MFVVMRYGLITRNLCNMLLKLIYKLLCSNKHFECLVTMVVISQSYVSRAVLLCINRILPFIFSHRMSFNDFIKEFTRLEICMLSPDSAGDVDRKRWEANVQQGSWQKAVSAGGCRNFPDSFYINPQYK